MGIETLPNEILCSIFLISLQSTPFKPNPMRTVLTISSVSRHWRQVAITFPKLWSSLVITFRDEPYFERVRITIDRCRSQPMDIVIYDLHRMANLENLMNLIMPWASCWRSFNFFDSATSGVTILHLCLELKRLGHHTLSFPALKHVILDYPYGWSTPTDSPIQFLSPALRRLTLQGQYDVSKRLVLFDLSNLTHLTIAWVPRVGSPNIVKFNDVVSVLKQTPLLEHLRLSLTLERLVPCDVLPGHPSYEHPFSVELPRLISLSYSSFGGVPQNAWMWLLHISSSQLSSLELHYRGVHTELQAPEWHTIRPALVGRLPLLKTFNWSTENGQLWRFSSILLLIFEIAPSISHLVILTKWNLMIDVILSKVKILLEQPALTCPMLENISFEVGGSDVEASELILWAKKIGMKTARLMPRKKLRVSIIEGETTYWEMEFDANGLGGDA